MFALKAAVIGTGFIGPVHIEGLRRAGVHVQGVLGSSLDRSQATADLFGIPSAYASLQELLDDTAVDVVHITTPNRFHFDQATSALNAGKHVLCEKPLAMNAQESAKLVAHAQRSGLAAGVNYNIRYYPLCLEAAQRVRSGQVGKVIHLAGSYVQDWLFHDTDFNWRVLSSEGGPLRAVSDIGTHWLDLMHAITGCEIEAVLADLQTVHATRQRPVGSVETFSSKLTTQTATEPVAIDTDDCGSVLLRLKGGGRGVMWVSQVTAGRKNCCRFEITGSGQSLVWNSESPNEMWIGHRDKANELLIRDPALLSPEARQFANYPGGHNEGFPDTFKQLCRDFYGYIARGDFSAKPTFPTFADGHREIQLCDAILESHRTQQWIKLG
ncbi:MAG: Gfo/Idh/MocA family oxidoreductase [Pirellulaceae bacterium]|nr:Gfo/Idh/MocA family oxidoreductase [Pirellulaceae bacterium]